jgi:hypothetical protein
MAVAAAILIGACGGSEMSATPIPTPGVACVGVPQAHCDEVVASYHDAGAVPLVQITVTCTSTECTATDGEVLLEALDANGQRFSTVSGYGNGAPPPPPAQVPGLPVAPICLGLPFATCMDLAGSAVGSGPPGGGGPQVVRITVRCKGFCSPTKGEGETRIDYVDGTNQVSSWGYESSSG